MEYGVWIESLPDSQSTAFAKMVSSLVDQLVTRRLPYHSDFELLKAENIDMSKSISTYSRAAIALLACMRVIFRTESRPWLRSSGWS